MLKLFEYNEKAFVEDFEEDLREIVLTEPESFYENGLGSYEGLRAYHVFLPDTFETEWDPEEFPKEVHELHRSVLWLKLKQDFTQHQQAITAFFQNADRNVGHFRIFDALWLVSDDLYVDPVVFKLATNCAFKELQGIDLPAILWQELAEPNIDVRLS